VSDAKPPELHVVDDPAAVVAGLLAAEAARGGAIVLTGGSAPGRAYTLAAEQQPDWSAATIWWGDDRCVPPDDPRSNYRLARETLLDHLEAQPREVHRIHGELPPVEAAAAYDEELATVRLDLVLLGLGPDGHMASLFPGSPQLDVVDRLATSGPAGLEPFVDRVTLTLTAIRSAGRIVFLVLGESKAEAVEAAFGGGVSRAVPASLARLAPVPVEVYLDAAAAARLPER
jgi:6-phosphogluconolactonase